MISTGDAFICCSDCCQRLFRVRNFKESVKGQAWEIKDIGDTKLIKYPHVPTVWHSHSP